MERIKQNTLIFGLTIVLLIIAGGAAMALELKSSAFLNKEYIPRKHTGVGPDVSPALSWSKIPKGTEKLALVCDDPDAPGGDWVHWVIYDIPEEIFSLDEGIPDNTVLEKGIKQGRNDFGRIGYGGPMPPPGKPHRYFFRLYALDADLELAPKMSKKELLRTIQGHILEKAELMGLYKR